MFDFVDGVCGVVCLVIVYQYVVEYQVQCVDVGMLICCFVLELFGCYVGQSVDDCVFYCFFEVDFGVCFFEFGDVCCVVGVVVDGVCDVEVYQYCLVLVVDYDVGWFEVMMYDVGVVCGDEVVDDLVEEFQCFGYFELVVLFEQV